ncbi:MAG: fused MFS/spermidine synthase [Acidobacteriota bacterium]
MSKLTAVADPPQSPPGANYLPWLLLLFVGSGCAALMYEIVWYQMLQLALGSTSISMGFLLASFMGGLCIGSIALPRYKTNLHPLKLYAYIEIGIAILGLLVLLFLPLLDSIYIAASGAGIPNMILRAMFAGICLLPPTILMGASLPAAARWISSTTRGASWWGFLYGGNTVGAVFGCLLTGFYILRTYNQATGIFVAMAINLVVAAIAWMLSTRTPDQISLADEPGDESIPEPVEETSSGRAVLITIGLSGATALGAEVVWTRLMGMLMGSTTYVFSIILAVFLIGLAIGSTAGAWIARSVRPRLALGWSQILLTVMIFWTCLTISDSLPYWPINPFLASSPWFTFQIDMARAIWAILPPTIFWGASFPLALAAFAKRGGDSARDVGSVYAANTLGAIIGALSVSLILVPTIGTQDTQRVLLVLAAVSALVALMPEVSKSPAMGAVLGATVMGAVFMTINVHAVPGEFIAYGRQMATMLNQSTVIYTREGINSSVAISEWPGGTTYVNVNGHVEATTELYDMALQRMVGHLPGLLHPNPKSVLGIGFGAGVSAGTFTRYPGIEHITICEIEPVIPPTTTKYFARQNYEVALNPKTKIVFDDARHFLMTTTQMFDIIASDPLDVFAKGTAALYSREYFDAVKRHLNPGGYFTLYVPLYESDFATVKGELATFFDAFPNATVWANTRQGQGYDMVFMGQADPLKMNIDEMQARLNRPDYAPVVQSLREVNFPTVQSLLATYTGRKADLSRWFGGAEVTHDRNLRLMYQAGWGINSALADPLYRAMLAVREIPNDIFTGSPETVQAQLTAIAAQH